MPECDIFLELAALLKVTLFVEGDSPSNVAVEYDQETK
jgi:hypothetical protein